MLTEVNNKQLISRLAKVVCEIDVLNGPAQWTRIGSRASLRLPESFFGNYVQPAEVKLEVCI
jgi:hypothetical protein